MSKACVLSRSVMSNSLRPHGLYSPWDSPGQNTGVGCHFVLQGIFPTQGSNPLLLHPLHWHFTTVPPAKPQWVRGGGESHRNLQCIARRSEEQVTIYTWDWPLKWAGVGVSLGGLIWCCLQVVSELSWLVGHPTIWRWRICFVGLETPYMWIGIRIATNKAWFLPSWSRNLEKRKSTRTWSKRRSKFSPEWSV